MKTQVAKMAAAVQLPIELLAALDVEARVEGLSRAAVIRRVLLRHVRESVQAPAPVVGVEQVTPRPAA